MSDEEKKAIEKLRKEIDNIKISILGFERDIEDKDWLKKVTGELKNDISAREIILNLIEKQSKEIEKLKEDNKKLTDEYLVQRDLINPDFLKDYVSKDKIKAKIEEVDIQLQKLKDGLTDRKTNFVNKNMLFAQKKVLQSLLEKE